VPAESTDGEGRGAVSTSTEGAALLRRRGHLKICFEAEGVRLGRRRASAKRRGRGRWGGGGVRRASIGMQGKARVGGGRLTPQQFWTAVLDKRQRSRTVVPDRTRRDRSWRQRCRDRFADPRGCPREAAMGDRFAGCLEITLGGAAATQGGGDRGRRGSGGWR
jgi:hypothetical protein